MTGQVRAERRVHRASREEPEVHREEVVAKPRERHLCSAHRTTGNVGRFDDDNGAALAREHGGGREPVDPGADDDDIDSCFHR
ncbi:unannotated protein [freshwater metagenome]|uniref:Unannotated protein n=1 Tax=freshwater metagenome TaxID=449393 RepID=A0A6J7M8H4_9ZZZZ